MMGWKRRLAKYTVLFLMGYCIYVAMEVTFRGYSFRLMGIVGGAAMAGLGLFAEMGLRRLSLPVQMLFGTFLITTLELFSGLFSLNVLHVRMWDYRDQWMSLFGGLICPLFSCIWYLISGLGIMLADICDYYVLQGNVVPAYRIFGWRIVFPERESSVKVQN